ncbi:MAG: DUF3598 family protein [Okeania sp. SIO3I5]|uniref:DUF3598 family protein n=1 Tax=Okeania sp. SIO3I5 TaxID=2607805 RepID=UPI0013B7C63A|nr:DUF3598 family protein [Okeania sp. SIO3I5]NEQ39391.1 DUF3598 family protein [Okeania sp. SIO3I5]
MKTQWENFLQNLGEWHGSFTKISDKGEILEDTPSILILESLDNQNKQVRLTLSRFNSFAKTPESKIDEIVTEYQTLGRNILFFEKGAFSKGNFQIAPFSINGAEFGFVNKNRRLRLVTLFNKDGDFDKLTLIREKRAETDASENPALTVDALLGKWQGEAITMYPDLREPDTYPTQMELNIDNKGQLVQEITFGKTNPKTITSSARIEGSILHFEQGSQPVKVLLLPDGGSATLPVKIELKKPLFFEFGWLVEPQLRQRIIRSYNDKGEWVSSTLVTEQKIK